MGSTLEARRAGMALATAAQRTNTALAARLHEADRDTLKVHPRSDPRNPLTGVFATRSPDRPNPIGLHRARLLSIDNEDRLHVDALEAIDGTPIIDIKPVLERSSVL